MNDLQLVETLRSSGLKKTTVRIAVLKQLTESENALSQPELETVFEGRENRVTVYRVLRDFEEKGLIHRIYDMEGTARFALCRSCTEHQHHDEHLHFNCVECKNVICLDNIHVSIPTLPIGFKVKNIHFTVEGVCEKCNKN
jgi:Fur family transcriptional regulator, ferric uptake regulator